MKNFPIYLFLLFSPCFILAQNTTDDNEKEVVGQTLYDVQTWRAMQNHIYAFEDYTKGIVWNQAEYWPGFSDQGIGYSYYDGSSWQGLPFPNSSITSVWARFPSYTAFGEIGELCFSQGQNGLVMSHRDIKGMGNWIESYASGTNFKHPFVVTSGADHSIIQLLYLDPDGGFSGTPAQPMRGSIRYSRSTDGGISWNPQNLEFDELNTTQYLGFTVGAYAWAQPRSGTLAFVAGDFLTDLVLMKSTDGGDSWQKTVIWEHPYPFLELGSVNSDTFYCDDGGISVALDFEGKAHVAFTLSRVFSSTAQDTNYYVKEVGGVVYWNEDRETFSNNINALNPYGHPDSELIQDYNLIGWPQDKENITQTDSITDFATYPTPGMSTMPQILIHDWMGVVVTWSVPTESFTNPSLRHIWVRTSPNGGDSWCSFIDLNEDLIFVFSENVYPSIAPDFSSDYLYYTFQEDIEPGLSGGNGNFYENNIWFLPLSIDVWASASFYADTTSIHVGDTLQFNNLTNGYPPTAIIYDWYFEGGNPMISNDTNPQVVYPVSGIFDVSLKATVNGIIQDSAFINNYINVLPTSDIAQISGKAQWELLPNPSTGEVRITGLEESFSKQINVLNLLGHEVFSTEINSFDSAILKLNHIPEGLYFVLIKSKEKTVIKKLILSR